MITARGGAAGAGPDLGHLLPMGSCGSCTHLSRVTVSHPAAETLLHDMRIMPRGALSIWRDQRTESTDP